MSYLLEKRTLIWIYYLYSLIVVCIDFSILHPFILAFAMLKYSGSISNPIPCRLSMHAAIIVVPLPMNGSNIICLSMLPSVIKYKS